MSKPRCDKVPYASRKLAKKFLKQLNHDKGMNLQDVYYCEDCSAWHMASMAKEKSREFRKHLATIDELKSGKISQEELLEILVGTHDHERDLQRQVSQIDLEIGALVGKRKELTKDISRNMRYQKDIRQFIKP